MRPRLLLLPSLFTDASVFEPVRAGRPWIEAFDPCAAGVPIDAGEGLAAWGDRIARHLADHTLRGETRPVWLGGFCLGGMLALAAAARLSGTAVAPAGVVLLASAPAVRGVSPQPVEWLRRALGPVPGLRRRLVRTYLVPSYDPAPAWVRGPLAAVVRAERRRRPPCRLVPQQLPYGAAGLALQKDRAMTAELGLAPGDLDLRTLPPVRHLHGDADPFLPLARVRAAIPDGVDWQLEVVPGAGHFLTLHHADRVGAFLDRVAVA